MLLNIRRFYPLPESDEEYTEPLALSGKTPAEKSGIGVENRNKWLGLIQKSIGKRSDEA